MNDGNATDDVVVGVDGSSDSDRALRWAAAEAERRRCTLRLVHAVGKTGDTHMERAGDRDESIRGAQALLTEAHDQVSEDHPDLKIIAAVAQEEPVAAILAAADGAAMTVLGTRGRGGFAALLLGSVSLRVAARTRCPLVVARGDRPLNVVDRVLVGVRDEADVAVVRFALGAASRSNAAVRAIHVWNPYDEVGRMATQIDTVREIHVIHERRLDRTMKTARGDRPDATVAQEVIVGRVAAELVEASVSADLLVVGAHPSPGPLGGRLGLVGHAVLHHAECPVVVVPDP